MRSILKSNKSQASIWVWFTVIIGMFIALPIVTYLVMTPIQEVANQINATNTRAATAGTNVLTHFTNFWDSIIIFTFLILTLLLFISAFFIDTHALFVVLYIISALVLIIIAPAVTQLSDAVWGMSQFASATSLMPMTDFIRTHIYGITLSIIILSGIIMYAKFKYFNSTWQ